MTYLLRMTAICFLVLLTFVDNAMAYNSYSSFLSHKQESQTPSFCLGSGNIKLGGASNVKQNCMPNSVFEQGACPGRVRTDVNANNVILSIIGIPAFYYRFGAVVAAELTYMVEVCNSAFVTTYAEDLMFASGGSYYFNNGGYMAADSSSVVISSSDIPYRFQCSDYTLRGYSRELCQKYPQYASQPNELDIVNVYFDLQAFYRSFSSYVNSSNIVRSPSSVSSVSHTMNNNDSSDSFQAVLGTFHTYFSFDNDGGKVGLCVGTSDLLLPLEIGCVGVAPPIYNPQYDPQLIEIMDNTRCQYLMMPRLDLQSFANDSSIVGQGSLARFLASDFHVTSTVVGCIKDLITAQVIPGPVSKAQGIGTFFQNIQSAFKQIAITLLVLYLSIIGIKLITSPQVPQKSEIMMMLLKFAIVAYLTTSNVWYSNFGVNQTNNGLYGMIMDVSEEIGDMFLQILGYADPMRRCVGSVAAPVNPSGGSQPNYQVGAVLGEYLWPVQNSPITISSYLCSGVDSTGQPTYLLNCDANIPSLSSPSGTAGFGSNVKTTIWDMVDCRIANYLNFGNCQYSSSGMILMWIFGPSFFSAIAGLIQGSSSSMVFFIVSSAYLVMLFLIIFKIVHIFILSFFVITLLVLMSPIFICFMLFPATYKMFESWRTYLIGYTIYPGLLFAFITIMFMTMDAVFFGYVGGVANLNATEVAQNCSKDGSAPYCLIINSMQGQINSIPDPCMVTTDTYNMFSKEINLWVTTFRALNLPSITETDLYKMLGKMLLFAVLFYQYMGKVADTLAAMSGLQGMSLSNNAMGSFYFRKYLPDLNENVFGFLRKNGSRIYRGGMNYAGKAYDGAANYDVKGKLKSLKNYVYRKNPFGSKVE